MKGGEDLHHGDEDLHGLIIKNKININRTSLIVFSFVTLKLVYVFFS